MSYFIKQDSALPKGLAASRKKTDLSNKSWFYIKLPNLHRKYMSLKFTKEVQNKLPMYELNFETSDWTSESTIGKIYVKLTVKIKL